MVLVVVAILGCVAGWYLRGPCGVTPEKVGGGGADVRLNDPLLGDRKKEGGRWRA